MAQVFVTGAAGFIGGYLVEELLSQGDTVIGLDDFSKYEHPVRSPDHPRYTLVQGDATDRRLVEELLDGCEHFVANAALIGGVRYMHDLPLDILAHNNRLVDVAVHAALRRHREGVLRKVTYVSSSMVYERSAGGPLHEGDQLACPPPAGSYGFQKLAVEYYARAAWDQNRLPFTIVRPFNCAGAGERRTRHTTADTAGRTAATVRTGHVIPDFVERSLRRENPFRILGDGRQFRTFTYVRDMAAGIALAVKKDAALNEDFNLSGREGCTMAELARLIWERVNPDTPLSLAFEPAFRNDVQTRRPDVGKAEALLGFRSTTPLSAIVDEVIGWVRSTTTGTRV